jgi:Associated with zinc fingers.
VRVLRFIDASKSAGFHTYSLPEDQCTRLLVKDLAKNMPEQDAREELEILGIPVQSVLQLRSQRRDPDPAKDRFPTPHFTVTVARGPLVSKVRSLTSLCGLRVTVERYQAPK